MSCAGNCADPCCGWFPFAPTKAQQRFAARRGMGQVINPAPLYGPPDCPDGQFTLVPGGPCGPWPSAHPALPGVGCMPGEVRSGGYCYPSNPVAPGGGLPPIPGGGDYPTIPGGGQLPTLPGGDSIVVTETECQQRERAATAAGAAAERESTIRTAAITAVVSGVVGLGLGYVFG